MKKTGKVETNNKGILVVSDLHFAKDNTDMDKSLIQTDEEYKLLLEERLKDAISEEKMTIESMIVAGDLTQTGAKVEFEKAFEYIDELRQKLNIDKENILIIPGNHDFNRNKCETAIDDGEVDYNDKEALNELKFNDFKNYYEDFYGKRKTFTPNNAVVDTLYMQSMRTVFIGINSVFIDSHMKADHVGFIEKKSLEKQLETIAEKYKDERKIAVIHHNGITSEDLSSGIKNWNVVKHYFEINDIHDYIFAHVHTSEGEARESSKHKMRYITCGSMGDPSSDVDNDIYILVHRVDSQDKLFIQKYKYSNKSYNTKKKHWEHITDDPSDLDYFVLQEKTGSEGIKEAIYGTKRENSTRGYADSAFYVERSGIIESQSNEVLTAGADFFKSVIKLDKLYLEGHFHWSPNGKSLSYLVLDPFFEEYNYYEKTKIIYKTVLEQKDIYPDIIIGYEMNGSILATSLAIEFGCDFSYITSKDRQYTKYEERLLKEKNYRTVLVIVDFLYKDYLLKGLRKRINDAYGDVEIFFCALFDDKYDEVDENQNVLSIGHIPILECKYKIGECPLENNGFIDVCCLYENEEKRGHMS